MSVALLTIPEVMASLQVSRAKVYDLIRARELETIKIGRCRRVSPAALEACLRNLAEDSR